MFDRGGYHPHLKIRFLGDGLGALVLGAALFMTGCTDSSNFQPGRQIDFTYSAAEIRTKLLSGQTDILWVIDNSGSMASAQARLRENFQYFADNYLAIGLNICVGVIDSTAYRADLVYGGDVNSAKLRKKMCTRNPDGSRADINQLVADFRTEADRGTGGHTNEQVFASTLQFLKDNEVSGSSLALFRPGSLSLIVMVGDEDDQSPFQPSIPFYLRTQAECPQMFGDYSYALDRCPDPTRMPLMAVSEFKNKLDQFFTNLSGPNKKMGVIGVHPSTKCTLKKLRKNPGTTDQHYNEFASCSETGPSPIDAYPDVNLFYNTMSRLHDLIGQVGGASFEKNIDSPNFIDLFDSIGTEILVRLGGIETKYNIDTHEDVIVTLLRGTGVETVLRRDVQFEAIGNKIYIRDLDLLKSLGLNDAFRVQYIPLNYADPNQ